MDNHLVAQPVNHLPGQPSPEIRQMNGLPVAQPWNSLSEHLLLANESTDAPDRLGGVGGRLRTAAGQLAACFRAPLGQRSELLSQVVVSVSAYIEALAHCELPKDSSPSVPSLGQDANFFARINRTRSDRRQSNLELGCEVAEQILKDLMKTLPATLNPDLPEGICEESLKSRLCKKLQEHDDWAKHLKDSQVTSMHVGAVHCNIPAAFSGANQLSEESLVSNQEARRYTRDVVHAIVEQAVNCRGEGFALTSLHLLMQREPAS